jgi:hypothetical protein
VVVVRPAYLFVVHSTCRVDRAPAHDGVHGTRDARILIMSAIIFILLFALSPVLAVLDAFGTQTSTAPPFCSNVSGTADPVVPAGGPGGDSTAEHRDPHAAAQMRGPVLVCARPS